MFDLQFSDLQDDHVFVNRLQDRISETGAPVQKTPLRDVKDEEFHQRAQRNAIEEFLLMKPPFVKVTEVDTDREQCLTVFGVTTSESPSA